MTLEDCTVEAGGNYNPASVMQRGAIGKWGASGPVRLDAPSTKEEGKGLHFI
jgi:hypothetical protein